MPDTKIISITEAMEITQEIPEILQRLQMLFDADVEFVELGVDGDQIIVKPVEKHSPSASASHVPSVNWDNDQLLVSKAIDEEKRYTLAPWYIPDSLDAHDEWADKDEIQRAFWNYLKNPDRTIKLQHNHDIVAGEWVEGLTWPHEVEVQVKHPDGDRTIKFPAGTPFLGVIWEPWAWQLIKDGEIRGLSIGGKGKRMEADLEDYSYENTGGASFTKTQTDFFEESEGVVPAATLDIIKTFIDSIIKHLPGKHDQATHGKGGYKGIKPLRSQLMFSVMERPDLPVDKDNRVINSNATGGYKAGIPEVVAIDGHDKEFTPRDSMWHHLESDGEGGFRVTGERQALHEKIVKQGVDGVPVSENPTFHMLGGGPATGKSTFVKDSGGLVPDSNQAVHLNSDDIKGKLPEYKSMSMSNDNGDFFHAASFAHEESSYLTEVSRKAALAKGTDIVLDGTGNGNYDKLVGKIQEQREFGYAVKATYLTVPTGEAVTRSNNRALDSSKRRYVPEKIVRETHASVSRVYPRAVEDGLFDSSALYFTGEGRGSKPILIAESLGSNLTILDNDAFTDFTNKSAAKNGDN